MGFDSIQPVTKNLQKFGSYAKETLNVGTRCGNVFLVEGDEFNISWIKRFILPAESNTQDDLQENYLIYFNA